MPTFGELQAEMKSALEKKTVLLHLVEYLDKNYRTNAGADPKYKLLDDSKIAIPESAIEAVVAEILAAELEQLEARITQINSMQVSPAKPEKKKSNS